MKQEVLDYLIDILTECNYLLSECKCLDYESFISNEHLKRAFVRSLEVIGEAAKNIPHEIRKNYPKIKWREVAGMRNKLIHEYFGVDYEVVWETIKRDVPELMDTVETILKIYREKEDG